jgi:hypothetical protein
MTTNLDKIRQIMLHQPSASFNALEKLSPGDLDRLLAEIEKDKHSSQGMHGIFQTVIDGRIVEPCIANENTIRGWLDESRGETSKDIGPRWFRKILQESPALIQSLVWKSADYLNPQKRTQIEADALAQSRKVFSQGARQIKEFSDCEANFRFVCSVLGNSFDSYQLDQAYLAGALKGLASVGSGELAQWEQGRIAQENELLKADAVTPFQVQQQKQIRQHRFVETRRSAVEEELHRRLVLGYERDVVYGNKKHPLPFDYNGQRLDASFIKKCDLATMKILVARFGDAQLTARLQGVTRASATLDRGDGRGPVLVEVEFL